MAFASPGFSSSLRHSLNCFTSALTSTHPDRVILSHWGRGGSGCEGTLLAGVGHSPQGSNSEVHLPAEGCTCLAVQQLQ